MKNLMKIIAFCILVVAALKPAFSQENIVKLYPVGFHLNTGGSGSNSVGFLFKVGFERVFTDKLSGQINLGLLINRYKYDFGYFGGAYTESYARFVIEPQVKYYLLDDAPHGLYVGGYFFVAARNGALMGIGPNVGYQFFLLDDRLALDANVGMGVGFWVGSGVSGNVGFDMPFQVGAGWGF